MAFSSFLFVLARLNLPIPSDWRTLTTAAADPGNPGLYNGAFRWSPVAAWLLAVLLPPLPIWVGLHIATAFLLNNWRLTLVVLASIPFWEDTLSGNVIIFVVVSAFLAVHGSRTAALAYFALALLMPRPIMLPVLLWLLWERPTLRVPFISLFLVHAGLVAASGLGGDWVAKLLTSGSELQHPANLAPSRILGAVWLPIGVAFAIVLVARGRIGLASLAVSPYVFPYYLLFGLLELAGHRYRETALAPAANLVTLSRAWAVRSAFARSLKYIGAAHPPSGLLPQRALAHIPRFGSRPRPNDVSDGGH